MNCKRFIVILFLMLPAFNSIAVNGDTRPYELTSFDRQLNRCYKLILSKLDKSDQEKLKNAQRQWIKFRDLDCMDELIDCVIDRTVSRLDELKETRFINENGNYSIANCGS